MGVSATRTLPTATDAPKGRSAAILTFTLCGQETPPNFNKNLATLNTEESYVTYVTIEVFLQIPLAIMCLRLLAAQFRLKICLKTLRSTHTGESARAKTFIGVDI